MKNLELKNQKLFNNFEAAALSEEELVEVNGGFIPLWLAVVSAGFALGFPVGAAIGIAKYS